ncbi:uncharacterized protein BCR38DRAFT_59707 [Pseudomassariella vexata]|uniref:FAD-binding domain-containing protein n=1 Tax=Pseudomassariella vexata TaxID=1141098 RepID=A0A1Y2DK08_9PEZI|nr:uncharacterized protein BCR38DRAFT_59707 [Pseudomassariella vexata]ORY59582.1 hypothetical protein BCR38DRAFT_59707 [Pseudomassariella vexata]
MTPLNIAIVGGGLGGPAAAIGLAKNGHVVSIYERSTAVEAIGYGFRITPNSDHCLKWLGIDVVAGGAVTANTARMMDREGRVTREWKENEDLEAMKQGTSVFAYRAALQRQLLEKASEGGVEVKIGVKVISVDVSNNTLYFDDKTSTSVDLIIGADGVHSRIRPHVVDSSILYPKPSTGHSCVRFMLSTYTLLSDPIVSRMIDDSFKMLSWNDQQDKRIVAYAVDFDRSWIFTCTHPEQLSLQQTSEGSQADTIAYNQKISLERVKEIYKDFDPLALRILDLTDPNGFRVWKLLDMDELPRWSVNHTVLLGDACHPVVPYGYSGASMSIEDAVTLCVLLPANVESSQIQDRLQLYEKIRKPRVRRVLEVSREVSHGKENRELVEEYYQFLVSHDAIEFAREELAGHLTKSH